MNSKTLSCRFRDLNDKAETKEQRCATFIIAAKNFLFAELEKNCLDKRC